MEDTDICNCFCGLVAQSCPILCDPVDCSTPGFPVLHHLPEFAQTGDGAGDNIQRTSVVLPVVTSGHVVTSCCAQKRHKLSI